MIRVDDRTPEQKTTHRFLVIGTDSFMSGWGAAEGGTSYAAWACTQQDLDKVERWVRSRREMKRVRTTFGDWRPRGVGHAHIYVVTEGHCALGGSRD